MGLVNSQIRLLYLQQTRLDLEYKIMLITQAKMGLSKAVSDLMEVGNDFDPDSPTTKMLQQRQAKLKVLEQKFQTFPKRNKRSPKIYFFYVKNRRKPKHRNKIEQSHSTGQCHHPDIYCAYLGKGHRIQIFFQSLL